MKNGQEYFYFEQALVKETIWNWIGEKKQNHKLNQYTKTRGILDSENSSNVLSIFLSMMKNGQEYFYFEQALVKETIWNWIGEKKQNHKLNQYTKTQNFLLILSRRQIDVFSYIVRKEWGTALKE